MATDSVNANIEGYAIGVDFGTLSGRAVVVRLTDGVEVASATHAYAHAVLDETVAGVRLPPDARPPQSTSLEPVCQRQATVQTLTFNLRLEANGRRPTQGR